MKNKDESDGEQNECLKYWVPDDFTKLGEYSQYLIVVEHS